MRLYISIYNMTCYLSGGYHMHLRLVWVLLHSSQLVSHTTFKIEMRIFILWLVINQRVPQVSMLGSGVVTLLRISFPHHLKNEDKVIYQRGIIWIVAWFKCFYTPYNYTSKIRLSKSEEECHSALCCRQILFFRCKVMPILCHEHSVTSTACTCSLTRASTTI